MGVKFFQTNVLYTLFSMFLLLKGIELEKEEVDKVIEDEITEKLTEDLIQSIERKFQVDLERSVDSVLMKIKLLLQNGTTVIQDRLAEIQGLLDDMKKTSFDEVETCLVEKQNETSALAEKALHQMVVCGYALIGHDPAQALNSVINLKNMIKQGLKPIYGQKKEVYGLLKVCGHDHDSLRKVIKCVISKSPLIKTSMMDVTSKMIDGVVRLTKLMAHGAMHEACLIEVIKSVEDEAFELVKTVKSCTYGNKDVQEDTETYMRANNATVINVEKKHVEKKGVNEIKDLLRRMLTESNSQNMDKDLKQKFLKLQKDLKEGKNAIAKDDVINNII